MFTHVVLIVPIYAIACKDNLYSRRREEGKGLEEVRWLKGLEEVRWLKRLGNSYLEEVAGEKQTRGNRHLFREGDKQRNIE